MKIKRPAETVEVCDFCRGDGFLQECRVCGAEFCLTCHATIGGCVVDPYICKDCAGNPKVGKLIEEYAAKLGALVVQRRKALNKLKPKRRNKKGVRIGRPTPE